MYLTDHFYQTNICVQVKSSYLYIFW